MRFLPKHLASAAAAICAAGPADLGATVCSSERNLSRYGTDRGAVIYYDLLKHYERRVVGADPKSFRQFTENPCFAGYAGDKDRVYYEGVKVPGANPRSFLPVAHIYGKDSVSWYGAGTRLAGRQGGELQILNAGYALHPEGAFFGARRLERDGFEVLGNNGYARSRSRAYFRGEEIQGTDAASFRIFSELGRLARDKNSIVVMGRVEPRFDAASFAVLTGGLVRDRNHVYLETSSREAKFEPVTGADPASVAWIGQGFWRDARSLYVEAKAVSGADPDSFRLIGSSYAVDKNAVYFNLAQVPGLDPESFQTIQFIYAKDKNGVYWGRDRLPGADAESFSARIDGRGWDKSYGYRYSKRACAWTREVPGNLPLCDPREYGKR